MTKRPRLNFEKIGIQNEHAKPLSEIFSFSKWVIECLKQIRGKFNLDLKHHLPHLTLMEKNYIWPCAQPLFCRTACTKTSVHVLLFVLLQRGSGNGWIIKAEKLFSTKKKSMMKTTTDRQRSCQSVAAKGSKERTKRQQLWKKYSPETQLMNTVSACWNKKDKNIKGKRRKRQFGTCLFQINLYRIHPPLSQATVLCWRKGTKYWSLWEHLNCFWSLY